MIEMLSPGGAFAAAMPHYEDRPEQRRMAEAVANALDLERALIVEAGTGTGKTLAYLLPALMSGKRVVISTGTRTLQEQLANRDIPLLRELAPRPFEAVVLKGVSNYLCRRRFQERWGHQLGLPMVDRQRDANESLLERMATWANDTPTGDRAEIIDIADDNPIWKQVTVDSESRLGPRCPFNDSCFVSNARRKAANADLIIVNHHLFFADLALRDSAPGARVLPDYDAVIFDEAHQLEDIITSHFGISVSTAKFARLARSVRELLGRELEEPEKFNHTLLDQLQRTSDAFFAEVRSGLPAVPEGERIELPAELFHDTERTQAWFDLDTALDEISQHVLFYAECADKDQVESAHGLARQFSSVRDALARFCEEEVTSSNSFVYWADVDKHSVQLRGAPVEIDRVLDGQLKRGTPLVFTSATLSTSSNLDYVRQRLGLDEDRVDDLVVDSPFDYASQAMFYIARDLPDPREPAFGKESCDRIEQLLAITEGRAFALFTSHRALRDAVRRLRPKLPYKLFVQGEQARASLLEQFRRTDKAVLFGTGSFWEGVDVPGDALSLVIIDKLPFAVPSDPLTAARMRIIEERGGGAFRDYQLPQAALALKQGFGRLIRRRDDRGIVAVLDNRLVTKTYGRVFVNTLPGGVRRTSALELVRRWWRNDEAS